MERNTPGLLAYRLSNGLQVVAHALPDVQSISACYYVRVGERQAPSAQRSGIAHFVEHMLFRSTQKRSGLQLLQAFGRIGAESNAATFSDATGFYACATCEYLEPVVELLSEMIRLPLLCPEEFETEKAVILQEVAEDEEEPGCVLSDLMKKTYFGNHPLGRPILGTRETMKRMRRSHLHAFWEQHYLAGNMILSVAGKFEEGQLIALTERCCGSLRKGKRQERDASYVWPQSRTSVIVQPHLQQQHLLLAMPTVTRSDPDYRAALLLTRILEDRLYWSILQKVWWTQKSSPKKCRWKDTPFSMEIIP